MSYVDSELNICLDCIAQIELTLANKRYLVGSEISLADIGVGTILFRLTSQGLNVPLPTNVSRWYDNLKARPAYQKSIMTDFSELKAREDY